MMFEIEKKNLRKKYISIRNSINHKKGKSQSITKKVIENEIYKKAKVVALYKSLLSEVDTRELIEYSIASGKIVALPRVVDNELKFYKINSLEDTLKKSKFGVEEPVEDEMNLIDKCDIDLVIVPGICFDKEKNRLGFGKGFYDRFLNHTNLETIAICFHEQIIDQVPTNENDIKMRQIITDKEIYL